MKQTKYLVVLFAAILFAISSCGNRNTNNNNGETHTHADGTVHAGPAHDQGGDTHTHADGSVHAGPAHGNTGETHTHADGSVHAGPAHDHGTVQPNTNEQEGFKVDSTAKKEEGHKH